MSLTASCREPNRSATEDARAASPVKAVVTAVRPGLESVPALLVEVQFTNDTDHPVTVDSYEITWPYGHFIAPDVDLTLAPGQVATRNAKVDELSPERLTTRNARVTVRKTK